MKEVHERLHVGSEWDCFHAREGWAVVHACKFPCHRRAVGYRKAPPKSSPYYLFREIDDNLYLNMIDASAKYFSHTIFETPLDFIDLHWNDGMNILVHCNKGGSRAPSIVLLFLAKRIGVIDASSYDGARQDFLKVYPQYNPSQGIRSYLRKHWDEF